MRQSPLLLANIHVSLVRLSFHLLFFYSLLGADSPRSFAQTEDCELALPVAFEDFFQYSADST